MKKLLCIALVLLLTGLCCACGVESSGSGNSSGNGNNLGDYIVEIRSCRLAEDYSGNPVVIVEYKFTNNSDSATSFASNFETNVYQDDIGLNECFLVEESDDYSADNQTKSVRPGASLVVEVAYELNDEETDIEVEVSEYFSFSNDVVTKTLSLN